MACRYLIYLSFAALTAAHFWLTGYVALVVFAYFFVAPMLLHWALLQLRSSGALITVHLLEAGLLVFMLGWSVPVEVVQLAAVIALASNTALWGLIYAPLFLTTILVPLLGVTKKGFGAHITFFDGAAAVVGLVFLLAICSVVHNHTRQLAAVGMHLRRQRHQLLRYLPADFPRHFNEGPAPAVREEWLTVAFVDVVGFGQLMNCLPASVSQRLLNQFLVKVSAHVRCWGGEVSKFLGDGVLCVFTVSRQSSAENTACQGVRCMYQLQQVLKDVSTSTPEQRLTVTIGMASGYCRAGHWGGQVRADYTVLGAPVNLASRLQQAAAPGQVFLDQTTAELAQNTLPLVPAQSFDLKGFGVTPVWQLTLKDTQYPVV